MSEVHRGSGARLVLALRIDFVAAGTPINMLVPEDMDACGHARVSGQPGTVM